MSHINWAIHDGWARGLPLPVFSRLDVAANYASGNGYQYVVGYTDIGDVRRYLATNYATGRVVYWRRNDTH